MSRKDLIQAYFADWFVIWTSYVVLWLIIGNLITRDDVEEPGGIVFAAFWTLGVVFTYLYCLLLNRFWHKTVGLWLKDGKVRSNAGSSDRHHLLHALLLTIEILPLPIVGVISLLPRLDRRRLSDGIAGYIVESV